MKNALNLWLECGCRIGFCVVNCRSYRRYSVNSQPSPAGTPYNTAFARRHTVQAFGSRFRFRPMDKELVDFLKRKVRGSIEMEHDIIIEVDICKCEPWDLPEKGRLTGRDQEWYFFRRRNMKYTNGTTIQRASEAGYWKDTGKNDEIMSSDMQRIGNRKSLTFYIGRPHRASQTEWHMHEYHLVEEECGALASSQDAYALCRVFKTK